MGTSGPNMISRKSATIRFRRAGATSGLFVTAPDAFADYRVSSTTLRSSLVDHRQEVSHHSSGLLEDTRGTGRYDTNERQQGSHARAEEVGRY